MPTDPTPRKSALLVATQFADRAIKAEARVGDLERELEAVTAERDAARAWCSELVAQSRHDQEIHERFANTYAIVTGIGWWTLVLGHNLAVAAALGEAFSAGAVQSSHDSSVWEGYEPYQRVWYPGCGRTYVGRESLDSLPQDEQDAVRASYGYPPEDPEDAERAEHGAARQAEEDAEAEASAAVALSESVES